MAKTIKTQEAFERYCAGPVVQKAIAMDAERGHTLTIDLLRDCFITGVQYGVKRAKAERELRPAG